MLTSSNHKVGQIDELDFMKCVFILLMVVFHLTFVSETFPFAKAMVYTFHMPGFLLISGYLMNVEKTARRFFSMILWLFVPYIVMESGYIVMASLLPINEHIDRLTLDAYLYHLLIKPLGPYWYLQTMVLCGVLHYLTERFMDSHYLIRLLSCAGACYVLSWLGIISFHNALYFFAGAAIRMYSLDIKKVFHPHVLSIILLAFLLVDWKNLNAGTAGGVAIVYFVMNVLMLVHTHLPHRILSSLHWIGRNTMPIFLFSPIFTVLCKPLRSIMPEILPQSLQAMLFIVVSLPLCLVGSILIAKVMDITATSSILFGRRSVLKS